MDPDHLKYLACPACEASLLIESVREESGSRIREGTLRCSSCLARFPIVRWIPRFVEDSGYAASFGLQWAAFPTLQYDSHNGLGLCRHRFFASTRWSERLDGEVILEAGSGAGAFTEVACDTGAFVVSVDLPNAVEVNYRQNGMRHNLLIVQGDISRPPVARDIFDRVFCFGVLQHTADPGRSFLSQLPPLRPGGCVVIDVYRKESLRRWFTSYRRVRWLTCHMSPWLVYRLSRIWVTLSWPLVTRLWRIPGHLGRNSAEYLFLIRDYFRRQRLPVSPEFEKQWAVMQLVDQLTAYYDKPQTLDSVREWFVAARLVDIEVVKSLNGIVGRGVKVSDALLPEFGTRKTIQYGSWPGQS